MLYPPQILNEHWCIYSCLQIPPRENWFQYVQRVYTTAINFPCIITLVPSVFPPTRPWLPHKYVFFFSIRKLTAYVYKQYLHDILHEIRQLSFLWKEGFVLFLFKVVYEDHLTVYRERIAELSLEQIRYFIL